MRRLLAALLAGLVGVVSLLAIGAVGFYVIFFAGIGWKVLATLGVLGVAALFPLWGMLHDYQRRRNAWLGALSTALRNASLPVAHMFSSRVTGL